MVKYHVGNWVMAARIPKFSGRVQVHVKWIEKDRRRDYDNVMSGIKPILDALVELERIVNDSPKWMDPPTHSFEVDKKDPRIEVTISSLEPGTPADSNQEVQ